MDDCQHQDSTRYSTQLTWIFFDDFTDSDGPQVVKPATDSDGPQAVKPATDSDGPQAARSHEKDCNRVPQRFLW